MTPASGETSPPGRPLSTFSAVFVAGALATALALQGGKELWLTSLLAAASCGAALLVVIAAARTARPQLPSFAGRVPLAGALALSLAGLASAVEPFAARVEWSRALALIPFAVLAARAFGPRPRAFWWIVVVLADAEAVAGLVLPARAFPGRAAGTLPNPTLFCEVMILGVAASLGLMAEGGSGRRRTAALAGSALLCAVAGLSSGSRVLLLGLPVAVGLAAYRAVRVRGGGKEARALLLGAAAGALAFAAAYATPSPLARRMDRLVEADPFANLRPRIWSATFEMVRDHPMGVGWGCYAAAYPRYSFPVEGSVARHGMTANFAHNEYLHALAEGGLPGAAGMAWFLAFLGLRLLRGLSDRRGSGAAGPGAAAGFSMAAGACVDFNFHPPFLAMALASVAALSLASGEAAAPAFVSRARARLGPRLALYGAAAGALLCGWLLLPAAADLLHRASAAAGRRSDTARAFSCLRGAVLAAPAWKLPWTSIGSLQEEAYARTGSAEALSAAEKAYLEAESVAPADPDPARRRGLLLLRAGRLADAEAALARASRLDPANAFDLHFLARICERTGRRTEAIAHWRRAVALEPAFVRAHESLSRLLAGRDPAASAWHSREADRASARSDRAATPFERQLLLREGPVP